MEQTTPKMPPEIAKAVVEVMGKVKTLGKEETNKHGGYKYVSVDQFFEKIGPLMSAAGIFVLTNEVSSSTEVRETTDSYGKTKSSAWLTTEYDILLVHESGSTFGPIRRNQQVSATGPQSYGASEAYVEKYFLRNLFKIPTGEADADAEAQEGLPAKRNIPTPPKPPAPKSFSEDESHLARDMLLSTLDMAQEGLPAKRNIPTPPKPPRPPVHPANTFSDEESHLARDMLLSTLDMAKSIDDLAKWQSDNMATIGKLLEEDRLAVRAAYGNIRQALQGREAAE